MKFTFSCGHALSTPGKESPDGYKEWSYTNAIFKYILDELNTYEAVQVKRIDDPTGKVDYPLVARSNMVNAFRPDLHIDLHLNALSGSWTSAEGTETFVYKKSLKEAVAIATKVQANLVKSLGFRDRGVKEGDLHMIRETNCTAILIEFAFMSNKDEAMKMRTAEYQKKAAKAVVDALAVQYKLKKKAVLTKEEPFMLEKAVVIFGEADYPTGKRLAEYLGAGVFTRAQAAKTQVAKQIFVVGGTKDGLKGSTFVVLSGANYFDTVAAVGKYLK
jgi:N-acetylmuramoyl-L-alanine amidase